AHYTKLVTDLIQAQGYADRNDVETLLRPLLHDAMTETQKSNKITYLLTKLRKQGVIVNQGSRTKPRWELSYAGNETKQLRTKSKKKDDGLTASRPQKTA
ncbi:MAG: transcriptional regulator, partial [Thermomicrobiales bacterium]